MRDRWACVSDLSAYFKKKDLLGGLTALEQAQLRANIGIIDYTGEGGQDSPIELTYAQFWEKYNSSQLITGASYAITDFQTIYSSNTYNNVGQKISWGLTINPSQVWKLYVRALSKNEIDRRVTIAGKSWEVEYDPIRRTLPDGTQTKGQITFLWDDNGNSAFYDFKNIRFQWTKEKLREAGIYVNQDIALYTFSNIENGEVIDSSEFSNTKFNILGEGCTNNVFIGDTYYNILEPECSNNIFAKGAHDCLIKWNTVNNRFNEPVTYLTGSIYFKNFETGNTVLSTAISKTIHKVNDATIVSFLDPITYAYQVVIV